MSRFICVRHCESDNVAQRAAGALPGARLTTRGHDQARALATRIRTEYGPIEAVYTSDAMRTIETARHLTPIEPTPLPDLAEIHLGQSEGATDSATLARTAEVLRSWVGDGDWSAAVSDGESGRQVRERVTRAFREIADRHRDQPVVVVGHVGSLTAGLSALCRDLDVWGQPLPHGVPFLVEVDHTNSSWRCDWPGARPDVRKGSR
jgi:broad specificity phosphatase PhoE